MYKVVISIALFLICGGASIGAPSTECVDTSIKIWEYFLLIPLSVPAGLITWSILRLLNSRFRPSKTDHTLIQTSIKKSPFIEKLEVITGSIEVLLYSFSILVNIPLFIAFWIGVKTALRWDLERSSKEKNDQKEDNEYYTNIKFTYLRFLIGNAINIIIAMILASIINGDIMKF